MSEAEQVSRIFLLLGIALGIIYITSKIIGEERKSQWFRKRQKSTVFSKRGPLGESCHFGVPCKWQGVVVTFLMLGSISIIGYVLFFVI